MVNANGYTQHLPALFSDLLQGYFSYTPTEEQPDRRLVTELIEGDAGEIIVEGKHHLPASAVHRLGIHRRQ
jgi:putative N-acetylmannosamine-6-phosphate epimerase